MNMHYNFINFMLTAALVGGLSLGVASCKDDEGENTNGNPSGEVVRDDVDPMDNAAAHTGTRWFTALAGLDSLSNDWQLKEYEPTVGQASQNNELSRIIVVSDIDEARQNFSSLASVSVDALSTTQTVSQDGVGTLTWTPSADGDANLAVVDVRITQMPRLRSIVYCTSDQVGKNGLFGPNVTGTAYYRFGDVVRDPQGYYWVCVRPAFAPSKEKSYWANIFNATDAGDGRPIPPEYLNSKWSNLSKYDNATIVLPTKLPAEREHVHNLNNLVAAIINIAGGYNVYNEAAARAGKGLGGFPYLLNGTNFLTAVSRYWDQKTENGYTVWEILFGLKHADMRQFKNLRWFYKGYSWPSGYEATLYCYRSTGYNITMSGDESYDEVRVPVREGIDIRRLARQKSAKANCFPPPAEGGFGNFLVRITTGDKLTTAKYSPYEPFVGGTKEIYRYNAKTGKNAREKQETENDVKLPEKEEDPKAEALEAPVLGCFIGKDGNFYAKPANAKANGTEVAAIVVHLGAEGSVEKGTKYKGMAMAVEKLNSVEMSKTKIMSSNEICPIGKQTSDDFDSPLDGIKSTNTLAKGCGFGHDHPAAKVCTEYDAIPAKVRQEKNMSTWFMPSLGQWYVALESIGMAYDRESEEWIGNWKVNFKYGDVDYGFGKNEFLWVPTIENDDNRYDHTHYIRISFYAISNYHTIEYEGALYDTKCEVRPFIAF